MNKKTKIFYVLQSIIAALYLLCMGCRSAAPPIAFYTLAAIPADNTAAEDANCQISIGIDPVKIPNYLDTPRIVTRPAANRIYFSEFNRWGGKLENDIQRVVAENISRLLSIPPLVLMPENAPNAPKYRIYLDIRRFEGNMGGSLRLEAAWVFIETEPEKRVIEQGDDAIVAPVSGMDYNALVSAHDKALAEMSKEIAAAIKPHLHR